MSYLDDMFSLEGKNAIVTGGARGIGKTISEGLLRAKVTNLVVVDILADELHNTVENFRDNMGFRNALAFECDLRKSEHIKNLVSHVVKTFGSINILVNNAGVTLPNEHPYPDEAWEETIAVNLRAPFELIRESIPYISNGSGSIINITSLNAEFGFPNNPAYLASKGGLKMMSKGFALDLGERGIRVNCVGPGYTRAPTSINSYNDPILRKEREDRTILGRWGEPDDLIAVIIWLASDSSLYVTGQDIYVDGGWQAKGL